MRKSEEKFCEVCGVSSTIKRVVNNKLSGMCLCEKHADQFKKYGEFKDTNPRGVFDPNEIRIFNEHAEIDTYDSYGNIVSTFIIDVDDVSKLGNHKWRTVFKNDKPYLFTGNQKKERIYFHKLVCITDDQVDHIDGNTLNNKKSNLRSVTIQQNMKNLQKKCSNTSGIRGISFDKRRNSWKTDFTCEKTRYYVKNWPTIEQAIYQRYILEMYFLGEYRNTSNDTTYFIHINNLTDSQKSEIIEYLCNKLNISKERVEKI